MANVRLGIPEALRAYCEGREHLDLEGADVGEVLRGLVSGFPALGERVLDKDGELFSHLVVIRNEDVLSRKGCLSVSLADGDRLKLFGAASGG